MTIRGKRIYRSIGERKIAGICGGFGDLFEIDPVLVRLLWIVATCLTGVVPGILVYLAAWLIVPEEPIRLNAPAPEPAPAGDRQA